MSSPPNQNPLNQDRTAADLGAVVEAIRGGARFLVTTHENPDGDALGSLLATHLALRSLGKDSLMFLAGPAPLPGEYRFLALDDLQRELPADAGERTLVAVDCANESSGVRFIRSSRETRAWRTPCAATSPVMLEVRFFSLPSTLT